MPANRHDRTVISAFGDGYAFTNSSTPTSLLPSSARTTLPPGHFETPGRVLRLQAHGRISTATVTPGELTLALRFQDDLGTRVNVFSSGAMALDADPTGVQLDTPWRLDATLIARTIGSSATVLGFGSWTSHAVIGSPAIGAGGAASHVLPYGAAPTESAAFDATRMQRVELTATWSVLSAVNTITLHSFVLESAPDGSPRREQKCGPWIDMEIETRGGRPHLAFPVLPRAAGPTKEPDVFRGPVAPWRHRA